MTVVPCDTASDVDHAVIARRQGSETAVKVIKGVIESV